MRQGAASLLVEFRLHQNREIIHFAALIGLKQLAFLNPFQTPFLASFLCVLFLPYVAQ
jgi:hypothetical protein